MNTKNLLFTFAFLLVVHVVFGQKYYNQQSNFLNANKVWAFPVKAGLDFNNSIPIPIKTELGYGGQDEGSASICDPISGALLFYTNGAEIWDKNDQIMPNGSDLFGNGIRLAPTFPPTVSTTQGVCIIPVIDESDKYYVFSLTYGNELQDSFAVYYSIVDMSLNNGLGDVVFNNKNIPLTPKGMRFSEAMIAVPGNCNDIWLLLHRSDSAVYDAYHVTKDGISPAPIVSRTSGPESSYFFYSNGSMAISPDRTKLAFCSGTAIGSFLIGGYGAICEFNASTGMVSNEIILGGISNNKDTLFRCVSRGAAFSSNGKKFYTYEFKDSGIVQYDVSIHNYDSINSSRQVISHNANRIGGYLRLYGDTIYSADAGYINIISDPNNKGIACNYIPKAITLLPGSTISGGFVLPNEVVYTVTRDTNFSLRLDTVICRSGLYNGIILTPSEMDTQLEYIWSDSSLASTLDVTESGTYWVAYHNSCGDYIVDTFKIKVVDMIQPQITIRERELGVQMTYTTYKWMLNDTLITEATQSTYNVKVNGDYRVIVTNEYGCVDTSDVYQVTNADGTAVTDINSKKQIRIYPNPATDIINITTPVDINIYILGIDGRILKIAQNAQSISISELSRGVYQLQIYDTSGSLLTTKKIIKISQ